MYGTHTGTVRPYSTDYVPVSYCTSVCTEMHTCTVQYGRTYCTVQLDSVPICSILYSIIAVRTYVRTVQQYYTRTADSLRTLQYGTATKVIMAIQSAAPVM